MKLLYIVERYPELSQTFVAAEIRGLLELGVEVEVAALQQGVGGEAPASSSYPDDLSSVSRISAAAWATLRSPAAISRQLTRERNWPPPNATAKLRGLTRIAPWIEAARSADHIHAHFATEAADIARLLSAASKTSWSFTAHATDAYASTQELARNLSAASFARAVAPQIHDRLIEALPSRAADIFEVPVAINEDRFGQVDSYKAEGPVIAVGRLVEKKGFDDLITAARLAADSLAGRQVLIVGDGPMRGQLEEQVLETGAPVRLLGALPNGDIPRLLGSASLFVAPSKIASDGDRDGRPTAIAEAMCAGLPILSTTIPGIPGLVDSGHGILVEPGRPDLLAEGLARLLSRPPSERSMMGASGSNHARFLHGHLQVARRMLDLFNGRRS